MASLNQNYLILFLPQLTRFSVVPNMAAAACLPSAGAASTGGSVSGSSGTGSFGGPAGRPHFFGGKPAGRPAFGAGGGDLKNSWIDAQRAFMRCSSPDSGLMWCDRFAPDPDILQAQQAIASPLRRDCSPITYDKRVINELFIVVIYVRIYI